ncbi:FtsX-like permease family protein [Streptomyces sp. NPDC056454]|uniref:FtsX-like permease family protein n=1 Tax=Streptomyces sp. NPDC056454 TaxID=3345823 RepID=UPI0036CE61D3
MAVGLVSLVAGFATFDGREDRGSARAPRFISQSEGGTALLWRETFDDTENYQHSVILIEPSSKSAPLPPGVGAWPKPGQAVLSPGLRAALSNEGGANRYGQVVGSISATGLEVPGERLAYVRPAPGVLDKSSMLKVAGFGTGTRASMGDALRVQTLSSYTFTVLGLTMLPAVAMIVVAARSGSAGRDRRTALLRALGAGRRARAMVNMGEAVAPIALGALLAAGLVASSMTTDWQVPLVDFTVAVTDLRRWAPILFAAVLAAVVSVLLAVIVLHRADIRSRSTRPHTTDRRSKWAMWLCPLMLLLAVRGPDLAGGSQAPPLVFLTIYVLGVLGTLATLPAVIASVVVGVGRLLVRYGNRTGRPGALIAGRWNMTHPGVTTRMIASIVIAIGLITQVQLWSSRLGDPILEAQATHARIGDSILTVDALGQVNVDGFTSALPEGVHLLQLTTSQQGKPILRGNCAALEALAASCHTPDTNHARGDARLREFAAWYGVDDGRITFAQLDDNPRRKDTPESLVLIGDDSGDLPVAQLKGIAYQHLLGPQVIPLGGEWLQGAKDLRNPATWVLLMGFIGVSFLALAAALNNLGDFLRFSRSLAPLAVLTSRRSLFFSTASWTVLVPLAAAGLIGAFVAVWLGTPLTQPGGGASLSWPVLTATLLTVEALALLFWWWGSTTAATTALRWRPTAD